MLNHLEKEQLCQKLQTLHSGDEKQLEVIFSESNRLIVEAPAGYGKTKTMISKVAYLLASGKIPHPKKILVLTFSVNAAYKIKKELAEQLPDLVQGKKVNQIRISDKLFVSNYHGFCRHILKRYGYLLHSNLSNLDVLKSVDDCKVKDLTELLKISYHKAYVFSKFGDAVKEVNKQDLCSSFNQYTNGIIESFLDKEYISFNGILALTLRIFHDYKKVLQFYQNYFPMIIVDEFQDTNILSWTLLNKLVSEKTQLIFLGDSLQRIYGFIGAIPNLIAKAEQIFSMERIALDKNHRFTSNHQMLQLDKNIRLNAKNPRSPSIQYYAEVPFVHSDSQEEEAEAIANKISNLLSSQACNSYRIAILTKQRGANIDKILEVLNRKKIPYFNALFGQDDSEYISFHKECYSQFIDKIKEDGMISQRTLKKFYNEIKTSFDDKDSESIVIPSLLNLLEVFLSRVLNDYSFLSAEDKRLLIKDVFDNRTLRQNIEYVSENVIVSTIHGAKGLEWDYVLMPDMEQYSMPNWPGLCGKCNYKSSCNLSISSTNEKKFLEELSVFYVGVTRARRQVFFFASKERINAKEEIKKTNLSCMLKLPGISLSQR